MKSMNRMKVIRRITALVMLFIGGLAAYTFVWDLGDVGIGLMTIFNIILLYPLGGEALAELKKYEKEKKTEKISEVHKAMQ